jgi:hypothetical protein
MAGNFGNFGNTNSSPQNMFLLNIFIEKWLETLGLPFHHLNVFLLNTFIPNGWELWERETAQNKKMKDPTNKANTAIVQCNSSGIFHGPLGKGTRHRPHMKKDHVPSRHVAVVETEICLLSPTYVEEGRSIFKMA